MTMVARTEAVALDDLDPSQLLLGVAGFLEEDGGLSGEDAERLASEMYHGRARASEDDEWRPQQQRWNTGEPGTSVEMRSPSMGGGGGMMGSSRLLRQSFSPMTDVFAGPYNSAAETPAESQGGSPEHPDLNGLAALGDDDDGDERDAGRAVAVPTKPSASSAIFIPAAPHMKRKLAFRDTPPDDAFMKRAVDPVELGEKLMDREAKQYIEKTGRRRGFPNILDSALIRR